VISDRQISAHFFLRGDLAHHRTLSFGGTKVLVRGFAAPDFQHLTGKGCRVQSYDNSGNYVGNMRPEACMPAWGLFSRQPHPALKAG